jgi:hypothetical protein
MYGEMIARVLAFWVAMIAVIAFVLGGLVVWGLPKLWAVLKPWIHSVTG